jgi:hypothetical protein
MKNVVFWNIKTQFVPHGRHITSPLESPAGLCYVRFEVFTSVTMKNAAFWDVLATRRNIPEDGILQDIQGTGVMVGFSAHAWTQFTVII